MAKIDNSDPMNDKQIKILQQIYGAFLYYARAVDCKMIHVLSNLATNTKNWDTRNSTSIDALLKFLRNQFRCKY